MAFINLKFVIKVYGILLCLVYSYDLRAISNNDSIHAVIQKQTNDTNKVKKLQELCWGYLERGDVVKSKSLALEALRLSKKINYTTGSYTALLAIANIFLRKADFTNAIFLAKKSLIIAQCTNYKKGIASSYSLMGNIYYRVGDFQMSINNHIESLNLYEELKYKRGIIAGYSNLANAWNKLEDYDKAIAYTQKALAIQHNPADSLGLVILYHNLVYPYSQKKNTTAALIYENEALKICKLTNNLNGLAYSYFGKSNIFKAQGNLTNSLLMLDSALVFAKKTSDYFVIASCYNSYANIYIKQKQYNKTLTALKEVDNILKNINLPDVKMDYELNYKNLYDSLNKPALAYEHYRNYINLSNQIQNPDKLKEMTKKMVSLDYEQNIKLQKAQQAQKDATTALKTQQKNSLIILLASMLSILILVTVVLYLYFARKNLKNTQQNLLLEQKVLRSQMNPHFIYNSLAMIHSYVIRNKTDLAADYIIKFSRLLRNVLENSRTDFVCISTELKTLKNYLEVQKLFQEKAFNYSINVDDSISQSEVYIPPMLAQPFIENALVHGFIDNVSNPQIVINFIMQNHTLIFQITDNGIGYSQSIKLNNNKPNHNSLAISITKERLSNLTKKSNNVISIIDVKNSDGSIGGTSVNFEIPYKIVF